MTKQTYIANVAFTVFVAVGVTIAIRVYDFVHSEEHITLKADVVEAYNPGEQVSVTPTATVTPTPSPIVTKAVTVANSSVESLIRATFGDDADEAIKIAKCESGLRPNAINKHNKDKTIDVGVFQINSIHKQSTEDMLNPEKNVKYAYKLFKSWKGWGPWYSSRKCHGL